MLVATNLEFKFQLFDGVVGVTGRVGVVVGENETLFLAVDSPKEEHFHRFLPRLKFPKENILWANLISIINTCKMQTSSMSCLYFH